MLVVQAWSLVNYKIEIREGRVGEQNYENSLYIGAALRHAPAEFKSEVRAMKDRLTSLGFNILEFVVDESVNSVDVYKNDRACVENCAAFLAIFDYPSLGLGGEASLAAERGVPMIGIAHEMTEISRWTLGEAEHFGYPIVRYKNMVNDVPNIVFEHFVESENAALTVMGDQR